MKKRICLAASLLVMTAGITKAQTLYVNQGEVSYAHSAANCGEMPYADGKTLTVEGKVYTLSEVDNMTVDNTSVDNNTVSVTYSGTTAAVVVAGNIAKYLTVTASGSNVSVLQSDDLQQEVTYTLSGTSTAGSFYMDGSYKAALVLDGLTLTSSDSAAVNIQDGKHIAVTLKGTNTLKDASGGSQNACLYIDGNPTFSGSGTLTVTGNAKHGITAGEKMTVESGTITVVSAVSDGIHVSEYFQMDGGTVTLTAAGDGLDVGFRGENKGTKAQYENNGFVLLNGGQLTVTSTGTAMKGIKADSTIVVAGATVKVTSTGAATLENGEISSSSAIKTGGAFTLSSGTVTTLSSGTAGKGINADGNVTVSGGTLEVTTTGALYETTEDDSKAQGVKSDGNIYLQGGEVYVFASSESAKAFKAGNLLTVTGGTILGVGAKKSEPTSASQTYKLYSGKSVTSGATVTYDGVSHTVPSGYNNSAAKILVSSAKM